MHYWKLSEPYSGAEVYLEQPTDALKLQKVCFLRKQLKKTDKNNEKLKEVHHVGWRHSF